MREMLSGFHRMRLDDLKVGQDQGKLEQVVDKYAREKFGTVEPGLEALQERHLVTILELLVIKGERFGLVLTVHSAGFYPRESIVALAPNNSKLLRQVFVTLLQTPEG